MRIVAGEWRGRRLLVPRSGTRPTADRARQILFDILGARTPGARVLDIYAGTGALGFEALSRGAVEAVFVESARRARTALEGNCAALGAESRCRVLPLPAGNALRTLVQGGERFGLILADPPYGEGEAAWILEQVAAVLPGLLEADGTMVVESDRRDPVPVRSGDLERLRRRDVGATTLHFFGIAPLSGSPPAHGETGAAGSDADQHEADTGRDGESGVRG